MWITKSLSKSHNYDFLDLFINLYPVNLVGKAVVGSLIINWGCEKKFRQSFSEDQEQIHKLYA